MHVVKDSVVQGGLLPIAPWSARIIVLPVKTDRLTVILIPGLAMMVACLVGSRSYVTYHVIQTAPMDFATVPAIALRDA